MRNPSRPRTAPRPSPSTTTTTTVPVALTPDPTPDTPHGAYDWTALTVSWDQPSATVASGASTSVSYTVTNGGTWAVVIPHDPSPDCLSGNFPVAPWDASQTMWPGSDASWQWCTPAATLTLAPGASVHYTDDVRAYATPAGGAPMPLRPGAIEWRARPWQYPCGPAPCDAFRGQDRTIPLTISPGEQPFTLSLSETTAAIPVGGHEAITATYRNVLGDDVAILIPGPCWKAAPPSRATCKWRGAVVTVPANGTAKLKGTVYPTSDLTSHGAPLARGTYNRSIAGKDFVLTVTKP